MKNTTLIVFLFTALTLISCSANIATADINDFESCVAAGYPILKTFPGRCVTPEGKTFIDTEAAKSLPRAQAKICKDLCGDGQCQEIVCMAEGCPCPENPEICPKDCK